jgi:hypothetical protein
VRRPATWLAVGVVLLVGVAAAADAVRQKASEPKAASTTTAAAGTTTRPPATGLSGVLYYTDEQCRLGAVQLPDLRPVEAPAWNECGFSLSPDALRVAAEGFIWHPGGSVKASQSEGSVAVVLQEGSSESSYTFRGSAPSFTPQARLAFASGTEIRMMDAGCPLLMADEPLIPSRAIRRCSTVIVPRETVERAARRHPNADVAPGFLSVSVRETAWLGSQEGPDRLGALLRLRIRTVGDFDFIAVFEGIGIVEVVATFEGLFERLSGLEASPGGTYFGVLTEGRDGVQLFDRETRSLPLPEIGQVRAFEWSPDEDWIALATAANVYIDLAERRQFVDPPPVRRVRIVARDLAWRR